MPQDGVSAMALVDLIVWLFYALRVDFLLIGFLIYKVHRRIYVFFKCFLRDLRYVPRSFSFRKSFVWGVGGI